MPPGGPGHAKSGRQQTRRLSWQTDCSRSRSGQRPIGSAFLLGNLDESVGGETKNPGVIGGSHAIRNAECLDHEYNCIHQTAMFARDVS
jgi:hypothetical protein